VKIRAGRRFFVLKVAGDGNGHPFLDDLIGIVSTRRKFGSLQGLEYLQSRAAISFGIVGAWG
jgi:hypothetical protein